MNLLERDIARTRLTKIAQVASAQLWRINLLEDDQPDTEIMSRLLTAWRDHTFSVLNKYVDIDAPNFCNIIDPFRLVLTNLEIPDDLDLHDPYHAVFSKIDTNLLGLSGRVKLDRLDKIFYEFEIILGALLLFGHALEINESIIKDPEPLIDYQEIILPFQGQINIEIMDYHRIVSRPWVREHEHSGPHYDDIESAEVDSVQLDFKKSIVIRKNRVYHLTQKQLEVVKVLQWEYWNSFSHRTGKYDLEKALLPEREILRKVKATSSKRLSQVFRSRPEEFKILIEHVRPGRYRLRP